MAQCKTTRLGLEAATRGARDGNDSRAPSATAVVAGEAAVQHSPDEAFFALDRCAGIRCTAVGSLQCSQCFSVLYCGAQCQGDHWRYHKHVCEARAKARQARMAPDAGRDLTRKLRFLGGKVRQLSAVPTGDAVTPTTSAKTISGTLRGSYRTSACMYTRLCSE